MLEIGKSANFLPMAVGTLNSLYCTNASFVQYPLANRFRF